MTSWSLAPATSDARRRGVLAFTCAVHLLALFLWTQERRYLPVRPPRVVTILLPTVRGQAVRPPAETALPPQPRLALPPALAVPAPAPQPASTQRREDDQAERERQLEQKREQQDQQRRDVHADAAPAPASSTPDAAAPQPNVNDTAQPAGPAAAPGGFALGLARQQAGRIDRELRKGKSGVPIEADTASARFQRGLESAHIDRTMALQSDTYTSPDGTVIYRFRQGNRVRCRVAGSVGIPLRGMPSGADTMATIGSAGSTDCPKGVDWQRDAP